MSSTTVIITHYNQHEFLRRALDSLRVQTRQPDAVIVVDDGSPRAGVEAICAEFPEVRLIVQKNTGVVGARRTGLDAARTDFVLHLDADDWLKPNAIADLSHALKESPDVAFAFGRSEKNWSEDPGRIDFSPAAEAGENLYHRLLTLNPIHHPGQVLIRRPHAIAAGGWRNFNPVEDYELWLRLAASHPIRFCPTIVSVYFQHGSNSSANPTRMFRALCRAYADHQTRLSAETTTQNAFVQGRGNHLDFYGRGALLDCFARRWDRGYPRPESRTFFTLLRHRPQLVFWLARMAFVEARRRVSMKETQNS